MTTECNQIAALITTIQSASYSQGIIGGIQEAARILRNLSGDAYKSDQDTQAELFRDMAHHLEQRASLKDDKWRESGGKLEQMERASAEIDARIAYKKEQAQ